MRYGLPYKGSKNAIAEWIVTNLPAADTFCDLFMGVGGTGIACKEAKRDFIGIEIDEKYFNIANYQINEADKENAQMTIDQYWGEE